MSSRFSIQPPFVVASLPQPIDHSNGRYVVGEVHGGTPGSKKRKRSEVTVGIHGEGVNLYDIPSSRLITSYAVPPQSTFTCAPCSVRTRISKRKIERRTYVSTTGAQPSITLFQDLTTGSGAGSVISSTVSSKLEQSSASVVFLGAVASQAGEDSPPSSDLLVVREDGEINCLDGAKLEKRWVSPASALYGDNVTGRLEGCKVEFAHLTNAHAASQGILKGRQDVLATFPQDVSEHGFNPDILIVVTTSSHGEPLSRTVHILTLPRKLTASSTLTPSVDCLLSASLPPGQASSHLKRSFNVHASAGVLQELAGDVVTTYDLNETLPKLQSEIVIPGATSFLRLSSASVMISSNNSIGVFNPKFQSVLATIPINTTASQTTPQTKDLADKSATSYTLVAHFPKLSTVIAYSNNALVAIQLENQHLNKLHGSSLLIDSLGRAIQHQGRNGDLKSKGINGTSLTTLESYLPGVISNTRPSWSEQVAEPDKLFSARDVEGFEAFFETKLAKANTNGLVNGASAAPSSQEVDRRWISYVLQRIFSWSNDTDETQQLSITFYPHKVFIWLLETGNLTTANLEAALREDLQSSLETSIPAGQLVNAVIDVDPEMALLLTLLDNNHLSAADLLHTIKYLMKSLELLGDTSTNKQGLLTNGSTSEIPDENAEEEFERLEAQAEEDLRLAEYHLGIGSGVRGQALSTALAKLYTCPSSSIVQALQTTMTGQEVVSLIYLLRFELVRGLWTSRYLDIGLPDNVDDDTEGANSTIILVSSLLNNCIDAIGAGGWLAGDAKLVNGDFFESEDLIKSLKLEVSAALDGIEEASYLKGLTSEFIRYGNAMQMALPRVAVDQADSHTNKKRKVAPVILPSDDKNATILPFGLKAEQQISRLRIGAGGEVQKRSARDIGRLKSKRIGKYSLERINI